MKGKRLALSCAVMAMTIASGAVANEIYKWTDENGNVHYEDRPSGAATEERLQMTYNRTSSSAVHQRVQARVDARTAREEAKTAAEASEKEAAENAAIAAERAQKCDKSRARLESYLQARRVYRTDENGERVYLDDDQRQDARKKAEEQISEFCS
jgi:major membrane immunogen (membrane-anchored lipoprotein)